MSNSSSKKAAAMSDEDKLLKLYAKKLELSIEVLKKMLIELRLASAEEGEYPLSLEDLKRRLMREVKSGKSEEEAVEALVGAFRSQLKVESFQVIVMKEPVFRRRLDSYVADAYLPSEKRNVTLCLGEVGFDKEMILHTFTTDALIEFDGFRRSKTDRMIFPDLKTLNVVKELEPEELDKYLPGETLETLSEKLHKDGGKHIECQLLVAENLTVDRVKAKASVGKHKPVTLISEEPPAQLIVPARLAAPLFGCRLDELKRKAVQHPYKLPRLYLSGVGWKHRGVIHFSVENIHGSQHPPEPAAPMREEDTATMQAVSQDDVKYVSEHIAEELDNKVYLSKSFLYEKFSKLGETAVNMAIAALAKEKVILDLKSGIIKRAHK